jgi:hypothetical protein
MWGMDRIQLGEGRLVVGNSECVNESSVSVKWGEFID